MDNPVEKISNIRNLDDFLTFVVELAMDAKIHSDEWENKTITEYLGQLASWTDDMSHYDKETDWDKLDYKTFAKM